MSAAKSVAASAAVPASTALISLAVIRLAGVEAWGGFVAWLLLIQLCALVIDWGSRDALLRDFSQRPSRMGHTWQTSLISRAILLPLGPLLFLALGSTPDRVLWLTVWLAALVVSRAHEAVLVYRRAFGAGLVIELIAVGVTLAAVLGAAGGSTLDTLITIFAIAAVLRAALLSWQFGLLRLRGWTGRFDASVLRRSWPFFALTTSGALGSRIDLYLVALLLPATVLGQYQVLTGLVLLIQAGAAALIAPMVPALYRLPRRALASVAGRWFAIGSLVTPIAAVGAWLVLASLYRIELPFGVLVAGWLATLPAFGYLPLIHRAYRDGRERLVLSANLGAIAVTGTGTVALAGSWGLGGAMVAAAAGQATVAGVLILAERRWAVSSSRRTVSDALSGM